MLSAIAVTSDQLRVLPSFRLRNTISFPIDKDDRLLANRTSKGVTVFLTGGQAIWDLSVAQIYGDM